MRRKTFDVLFDTKAGMTVLVKKPCLWRSAWYFAMSTGFFAGVATNVWLMEQPLGVRFAIIIASVMILGTALTLYGFLLHGILETFGAVSGDPKGLICLLGYTTLPFLLLTPVSLLAGKLGLAGLVLLAGIVATGFCWMLYLLMRSLEVVYLIDFKRSVVTVLFSLLLLYIVFIWPLQIMVNLLMRILA